MANTGKIVFWSAVGLIVTGGVILLVKKITSSTIGKSSTDNGSGSATTQYNQPTSSSTPSSSSLGDSFPLVKGSRGNNVKTLQRALGITLVDGILGNNTETHIHIAGYNLPLSESDFNKIVAGSTAQSAIIKSGDAVNMKSTDYGLTGSGGAQMYRLGGSNGKGQIESGKYAGKVTAIDTTFKTAKVSNYTYPMKYGTTDVYEFWLPLKSLVKQ